MSSGHARARLVFIESMATDRPKDATNVHLHIKVIYLLITVLCFGFAFATWICVTEMRQLRSDLDSETTALRRGEVVEFDDDDVVASHGDVAWDDHDSASESSIPRKEVTIESMDDRVRVRRGAKRRRSRPAFYVDDHDGKEGSGESDGGSDDWVWLTSYSRIPVGTRPTVVECRRHRGGIVIGVFPSVPSRPLQQFTTFPSRPYFPISIL